MNLTLGPELDHIDCVTFGASCRHCGGALRPVAPSRTDGCTAYLQVRCCVCPRSFVIRAEMVAVTDPALDDRHGRTR